MCDYEEEISYYLTQGYDSWQIAFMLGLNPFKLTDYLIESFENTIL